MNFLRILPLALGCLFVGNLPCSAQELPESKDLSGKPEKKTQQFRNPPALLSHTESSSLNFLIGTWLYQGDNQTIEETWVKSSLDELTCIRIKRTISCSKSPTRYSTTPTDRDPSLPIIEKAEPETIARTAIQEKEIYSIQDAGRGATVSIARLDNSKAAIEDCWVGSLDQREPADVTLKLLSSAANSNENLTITYRKIAPSKVLCIRTDGKTTQELAFSKINKLAGR